jgi:hypothetical protein
VIAPTLLNQAKQATRELKIEVKQLDWLTKSSTSHSAPKAFQGGFRTDTVPAKSAPRFRAQLVREVT